MVVLVDLIDLLIDLQLFRDAHIDDILDNVGLVISRGGYQEIIVFTQISESSTKLDLAVRIVAVHEV